MPDWPHSPLHRFAEAGTYMVTGATLYHKLHFLGAEKLDLLQDTLFQFAASYGWQLQAWALLPNHYHFVAISEQPENLWRFIKTYHSLTSREANKIDGRVGRRVWFQYCDSHITYQASYLARLRYVHYNPVHHGLVRDATQYRWCSARWFEQQATTSFYKTVRSFPIDRLKVMEVECKLDEDGCFG